MAQVDSPGMFPESPMESDDVVYPCKGCGEILEEGKAFELAGNRWHIDCFRCNTCGTLLDSDANLLLLGDGSLICNNCTYSCNACGNKIEDLAILTGDQAFCSTCFRCRNCKKKIENLRYARTSQGIFCMSCHESLMARRRKKAKGTPKPGQNATMPVREKALPSLPPGAATQSAFSPEMETPPSEAPSETPGARSPPERQYKPRRDLPASNMKRDVSPLSDDTHRGDFTTDGRLRQMDVAYGLSGGPTLPASTYNDGRPSNVSQDSEDGEERGFLPMAFDPNPAPGPPPMARQQMARAPEQSTPVQNQNDPRSRDYFGKLAAKAAPRDARREDQRPSSSRSVSTEREIDRTLSQAKHSPHILYQEKGRHKKRETSGNNTPATTSAVASPSFANVSDRPKPQHLETSSYSLHQNDGFKLQEVPKSKRAGSRSSSKAETTSPKLASPAGMSPIDRALKTDAPRSQSPVSLDSPNSGVNPFDDPKRKENGGSGSLPLPPKAADRPARGDSLAPGVHRTGPNTPETSRPTTTSAKNQTSHERKGSTSSIPSSFADANSTLSRDNSRSKAVDSPAIRSSFDAPPPRASSRPTGPLKALENQEFTSPRQPPHPPPGTIERHRNHESISTLQSVEARSEGQPSPTLRSSGLPRPPSESPFSMEEEMSRIMRGDSKREKQATEGAHPSVLRKVSNAVKHGRSFSDRGLHSAGKASSSGGMEISPPMTISSPMMSSPMGKDSVEQLAAQLKRAQHRIAELEAENNRLEEKVDSSNQIKEANNELREKRSTIVVLDAQREMVVRELEVMTEHLSRAKESSQPLDLSSLKSDVLRDYAESLQKLKVQMSGQIEELMHRRNQLTEEIGSLIQMKDKGFQEYETLSNKNAQLLEMNNQIVHNIQDMYKSNRGPNGTPNTSGPLPNGLGIYHPGGRAEPTGPSEVRNLNMVNTDSSMPNLLQETEAEPATVLTAPQVVNIRKGQPRKFNWRKGGEKMAKNVTKGIKGAFASERGPPGREGESLYGSISMPYNAMQTASGSDQASLNSRPGLDASRGPPAFGLFGQKNGGLKAGGLENMKNNSSSNLVIDASILFGSELEARCEYERRVVPSIVSRCIEEVEARGMDVEGVYRKSGGSGQVKSVQQGFEKEANYDISDPDLDIHAVTSALKQYFRKLPTPLITYEVYDSLLKAGGVMEKEKQAHALRVVLAELPERHRDCLEFLIQHLARVMSHEGVNLMTPLNLAVVFAPTIMRPRSIEREMSDMQAQRIAVQSLLEHHDSIFPDE